MKQKKYLVLLFLAAVIPTALAVEFTIVDELGDPVNMTYDIKEMDENHSFETIGSLSYTDNSLINPDASLRICAEDEINQYQDYLVQLFYTSYSGELKQELLSEEPQIRGFHMNHTENCAEIDIDISPFEARYPGHLEAGLRDPNEVNTTNMYNDTYKMDHWFPGEYTKLIHIDPRARRDEHDFFFDAIAYSDTGHEIESGRDSAILSIVRDDEIVKEGFLNTAETVSFQGIILRGEESMYINDIFTLETKVASECTDLKNLSEEYFLLNGSQQDLGDGCVTVDDVNSSTIDLGGNRISGDDDELNGSKREGTCGVTITNSNELTVINPNVDRFDKGICVKDSENITIVGGGDPEVSGITTINEGIVVENSNVVAGRIKIDDEENNVITAKNGSNLHLSEVKARSIDDITSISGEFFDVDITSVEEAPEPPEEYVPMEHYINITKASEEAEIREIGFNYGHMEEAISPVTIFQQRRQNDDEFEDIDLPSNIIADENYIYTDELLTDFSIFGAFGEWVEADPGEDQEAPGVPEPEPEPDPTPDPGVPEDGEAPPGIYDVNLTLLDEQITLEQGEIGEVEFLLENMVENHPEDLLVQANVLQGWDTVPYYIERMSPLENITDSIMIEVFENEIVDTYIVDVAVIHEPTDAVLDIELLEVEVELRQDLRSIDILEAPAFMEMETGETQDIGLLVENVGDYDLENLELEFRNADGCIDDVEGTGSVERGETENIVYEIIASEEQGECSAVMILSEGADTVGFSPVQITIEETDEIEIPEIPVTMILLVIWTLFTIYWMVFEYGR